MKVAAIFSNHMVLQQGKAIAVFGAAEAGSEIDICLYKDAKLVSSDKVTVGDDGRWLGHVTDAGYGTDYALSVRGENQEVTFTDVAVGEVFLAGGQSNMELELRTAKDGARLLEILEASKLARQAGIAGQAGTAGQFNDARDQELADCLKCDIRFYYTQKRSYFDEKFFEDEANSSWQRLGDEWTKSWSAVGFFFGSFLARQLKVPVGILGCNWGGTSASCWISRDELNSCESTRTYVEDYDKSPAVVGKTYDEQIADYEAYVVRMAEWDKQSADLYSSVPGITFAQVEEKIGKCPYPGPLNAGSFLRAAGLHETMIKRVAPYTLKGFIYYQGESDDHRPAAYFDLMSELADQWRQDFDAAEAPIILTQLPMHKYEADEDWKHWPLIREAQLRAEDEIPGVSTAVIIDQGEFNEIHPKYKKRVGERLAILALANIYHRVNIEDADAPKFSRAYCAEPDKSEVTVEFKNCRQLQVLNRLYGVEAQSSVVCGVEAQSSAVCRANAQASAVCGAEAQASAVCGAEAPAESGSEYIYGKNMKSVTGFELAGEDGDFYPATATICDNRIKLYSDKVAQPSEVRYLWTNYSEVALYGETKELVGEPLPVAPFRAKVEG